MREREREREGTNQVCNVIVIVFEDVIIVVVVEFCKYLRKGW